MECYKRAFECTPTLAYAILKAIQEKGIDVVVAPYEADAQLTYLQFANIAQYVITVRKTTQIKSY
jgi:exonuclease-1